MYTVVGEKNGQIFVANFYKSEDALEHVSTLLESGCKVSISKI